MYTKIRKVKEGFTIVETLIVLAIAALILTIILIAVPDLQRSSRNTNILHDAQNIASAVQSFESNNQGAVPNLISAPASNGTVTVSLSSAANDATTTAQAQNNISINTAGGALSYGTGITAGTIVYAPGSDCNTGGSGQATGKTLTPTPDARAFAVYYPIESSGGGSVGCIQE